MSQAIPALVLSAAAMGAALSLPRWRSLLGLSGELAALTALIALHGRAIWPTAWFPGRTVELVVLFYAFVRMHRRWATLPGSSEPSSTPRAFDAVLDAKNAHLLVFSAYVIAWSALADGFYKWSSLIVPLASGVMALQSRRAALIMLPIPFLAGIMYLAIIAG